MKYILSTKIFKLSVIIHIILLPFVFSCKTIPKDIISDEHADFLQPSENADEAFRVLIISDRYKSSQMKFTDQLKRADDPEGDVNTFNKLKEYDKINEVCEGTLTVWLYPDSGKLMKIRPKILAPIAEINSLIVDDLKRWNFDFSSDVIEPNIFDIKYRVVLRKIQSDEEIMKEVIEKSKKTAIKSDD